MKKLKTIFIIAVFLLGANTIQAQDIFRAAMSGDLSKIRALLEEHPELINETSWGGWTPLHRASQFGHKDIVDLLISKGADLEAKTDLGMTPLYVAIVSQKEEIVDQLIKRGADVFAVRNDGETMLHIAAAVGSKQSVESLISKGLKADMKRRFGITPLHLASVFGHQAAVEALISNGADVNMKNDNGSTPLHLALAAGETQIAALLTEKGAKNVPEEYVKMTGEYLGQRKPGSTPELFAPQILLNTHRPHGHIAFSPDGKEIYFDLALTYGTYQKIWLIRETDGRWNPPKVVSLIDKYPHWGPAFSPDGKRLYFNIAKPAGQDGRNMNIDICLVEKISNGWSDPYHPGDPLNSDKSEQWPSISQKGTVYFVSPDIEGRYGAQDIYRSRLTKGQYEKPENLGDSVNTGSMETGPYIAPDESYLLFSSFRPEGYGDFDIYVSYRKEDGTWTKAKNLGATINSPARDEPLVVSPDGKYLFFMSRRNGIGEYFWVSAKIIEDLKPRGLRFGGVDDSDKIPSHVFCLYHIDPFGIRIFRLPSNRK